jgi:hypothetical protein
MPRPQFSIRTLLWLTLDVAILLGILTAIYRFRQQLSVPAVPAVPLFQGKVL